MLQDIDLNNNEYIAKLKEAFASKDGQIIAEFLNFKLEQLEYESEVDVSAGDEEVGRQYRHIFKLKKFIKEILMFNN